LGGWAQAPPDPRRVSEAPGAERRALSRPRISGDRSEGEAGAGNVRAGVPGGSQGGELEAPADVRYRPVHVPGPDAEGVRGRAPATGICGPVDGGAEEHHLHDAHRHEVQRQQAARRKISEGGDGT
jgi:hypothetical protein